MSQQINLLQQKQQPSSRPALIALAVAVAGIAGILLYGASVSEATKAVRKRADAGEAQLTQLKATVAAVQAKKAGVAAAQSPAEIAQLRTRAEAARQLVGLAKDAGLGSQGGFSREFQALNAAATDGVWLTSADFGKGGGQVAISGGAMNSASVIQYAKRLNETYRPLGVRFNNVEVVPDAGGSADKPPGSVSFKLS
jgi:hypothetical protein